MATKSSDDVAVEGIVLNSVKENAFLDLLGRLADNYRMAGEVHTDVLKIRKRMGKNPPEHLKAKEIAVSNELWKLRVKVNKDIRKLGKLKNFYAATKNDLSMIHIHLQRKVVKISDKVKGKELQSLINYARYRNIPLKY
ncbi:unnamed protein product [Rhodiola kirilowii]